MTHAFANVLAGTIVAGYIKADQLDINTDAPPPQQLNTSEIATGNPGVTANPLIQNLIAGLVISDTGGEASNTQVFMPTGDSITNYWVNKGYSLATIRATGDIRFSFIGTVFKAFTNNNSILLRDGTNCTRYPNFVDQNSLNKNQSFFIRFYYSGDGSNNVWTYIA